MRTASHISTTRHADPLSGAVCAAYAKDSGANEVQLANVISDIVGGTGQKIVRAIIDGERDGRILANLKSNRIRTSKDEIEQSLVGN